MLYWINGIEYREADRLGAASFLRFGNIFQTKEMLQLLFGKYINRYYLRYAPTLIIGLAALILVDYMQLIVPELYKMVINCINSCTFE